MNLRILAGALLLALSTAAGAATATPAAKAFETGVQAYRAGNYELALRSFQKAQQQGMRGNNLEFNLGLAYYRLGYYTEARELFQSLRQDLRYTAMADYHLGLIAARMGERERAEYHLSGVRATASDPALRGLAEQAMRRNVMLDLPRVDEEPADIDVAYYLLVGSGYDTNPALVADPLQDPAESNQAPYLEVSGDVQQPLFPRVLGPWSGVGSVRLRNYSDHDTFDELDGELGLRRDWRGERWRTAAQVRGGLDTLGGEDFQRSASFDLDVRRVYGGPGDSVGVDLRAERIAGGPGFEYLDGWRQRAGIDWRAIFERYRLRIDYQYALNDRADFAAGDEFFSHSPRRQSAGISFGRQFGNALGVALRARYRNSVYRDPDRIVRDDSTIERRREEDLATAGIRTRLKLVRGWNWLIDYQYSENRSTRDAFDYDRHLVLMGIEWLK